MSEEPTTPRPDWAGASPQRSVQPPRLRRGRSIFAPDAVTVGLEGIGTFEGAAAIRGFYEDAASSLDDFHVETEEIIDLGNGVTFVVVLVRGHPVASSGEVQMRFGSVTSWSEAVIERQTGDTDIDEARAAAERLAEERG